MVAEVLFSVGHPTGNVLNNSTTQNLYGTHIVVIQRDMSNILKVLLLGKK